MKATLLLCLVLSTGSFLAGQEPSLDPYSLSQVEPALRMAELGVATPWTSRNVVRLGDGASVALLKIFSAEELENRKTAKACLLVIRIAFYSPSQIAVAINKDPKVTLFLLEHMQDKINDPQVQHQIGETRAFVKTQTAETISPAPSHTE